MARNNKHRTRVAPEPKPESVQIATWVSPEFAERVDAVAKADARKRASMVRILLEEALANRAAKEAAVA